MKITTYGLLIGVVLLLFGLIKPGYGQNIITVAGNGVPGYTGDGVTATASSLHMPYGVAIDSFGNFYIADYGNNRIRRVSNTGIITTVAGTGSSTFSGDGGPASSAAVSQPFAVTLDRSGRLVIDDTYNNRIRLVDATGNIHTIAGNGGSGYSGDGGPATNATFDLPDGIAYDTSGNLFITDWGNNVVRKVATTGIITTIAGTGSYGYSGDGGAATLASLAHPCDLAFDNNGNLYVVESAGCVVRKISPAGVITTYAGTGAGGYSGEGLVATVSDLYYPSGIAIDRYNNLYIADASNQRIRKVNTAGIMTTIAGTGAAGSGGDGGAANLAQLSGPGGIRVDINNRIFIADANNNKIRMINADRRPNFSSYISSLTLCEDTSAVSINSLLAVLDSDFAQTLTWSGTVLPLHGTLVAAYSTLSTGTLVTPTGLSYTPATGYSGMDSFMVVVSDGMLTDTTKIIVNILPGSYVAPIVGVDSICIPTQSVLFYTDSTPGGTWSNSQPIDFISPTGGLYLYTRGADTIYYTVAGACGSGVASKVVFADSVPAPAVIMGPDYLCVGSVATFSDSLGGGVWTMINTNAAIGSTGVATGLASGFDTVYYTASNSCGEGFQSKNVVVYSAWTCDSLLAVAETNRESDLINLYPNPNTGVLHIDIPVSAGQTSSITIYNVLGQQMFAVQSNAGHVLVDSKTFAPGVYVVRIQLGDEVVTRQFVKSGQ